MKVVRLASSQKHAFSLVELSIVLVILGLLTGGILAGQSLIRAAELRSVTTDYQRYVTAMHTFRDKYMAISGDMANATRFWGDDNAACPDAAIPNGTPGTCNGNGNGINDIYTVANGTAEVFQIWKQLQLAGLIEGSYTGLAGSGGAGHAMLGTNVPRGKISSSGFSTAYYDNPAGDAYNSAMNYGNQITFGRENSIADISSPVIKPEEAWNIDTKIDDGKPGRGSIIAIYWDTCTLATSATDLGADYDLTNQNVACAFRYRNAY